MARQTLDVAGVRRFVQRAELAHGPGMWSSNVGSFHLEGSRSLAVRVMTEIGKVAFGRMIAAASGRMIVAERRLAALLEVERLAAAGLVPVSPVAGRIAAATELAFAARRAVAS